MKNISINLNIILICDVSSCFQPEKWPGGSSWTYWRGPRSDVFLFLFYKHQQMWALEGELVLYIKQYALNMLRPSLHISKTFNWSRNAPWWLRYLPAVLLDRRLYIHRHSKWCTTSFWLSLIKCSLFIFSFYFKHDLHFFQFLKLYNKVLKWKDDCFFIWRPLEW